MKTIYLYFILFLLSQTSLKAQSVPQIFQGATIHLGNGQTIENGYLVIADGKIQLCSKQLDVLYKNANYIDLKGKHIYPGLIAMSNMMGLNEIEAVRATLDFRETGEINPNVRSLIAYNTDSKILPTAVANGILFTQAVPQGGVFSGTSSVMRTHAWNWEDAVIKQDDGVHLNWPEQYYGYGNSPEQEAAQAQKLTAELAQLTTFFESAQQYANFNPPTTINIRLEAMKPVLAGKSKLYVHASSAKTILSVLQFFKQYPAIQIVLVDATDAWQVKEIIKDRSIPVVFNNVHQLPKHNHSAIDQPYKTVAELVKAGITVAIGHNGYWEVRNLMFNAGTAVAFGLTKEEALQCITLNPAKIMGIDSRIGSLEKNKDASFVVTSGDLLDMQNSLVERVVLDGKEINLNNQQVQLYQKYLEKYGIKE